jgi:hypothetical protein
MIVVAGLTQSIVCGSGRIAFDQYLTGIYGEYAMQAQQKQPNRIGAFFCTGFFVNHL